MPRTKSTPAQDQEPNVTPEEVIEESAVETPDSAAEDIDIAQIGAVDMGDEDPDDVMEEYAVQPVEAEDQAEEEEAQEPEKEEVQKPRPATGRETTTRAPRSSSPRQSRQARIEETDRRQTAERHQTANESALISAINTHRILNGNVASVENIGFGENRDVAAIVSLQNAFKVIIPFQEIFNPSPINSEDFPSRHALLDRKRVFLQRMIGAETPFCITAYERDGDDMYFLGSRILAMQTLRQRTFGGENPRYKVGDVVTTRITSVNNSSLVTHIGGIDVIIRQRRLTRRYTQDLHDRYNVGDELRAVLTDVRADDDGNIVSIRLDPIAVEIAEAKSRYHLVSDNSRCKGIITGLQSRTLPDGRVVQNMYAWIKAWDLFARIISLDANSFGRNLDIGRSVLLTVVKNGHSEDGYLICRAEYDFGNNGMLTSSMYRA